MMHDITLNSRGERCLSDAYAMHPTFAAFRLLSNGETQRLSIEADTLAQAVTEAATSCQFKDTFCIRATDPVAGKTIAHFYAVKRRSTPRYVIVDHVQRRVNDLYADALFQMAVSILEPVERWQWSPGADVVGGDRSLVEVRA